MKFFVIAVLCCVGSGHELQNSPELPERVLKAVMGLSPNSMATPAPPTCNDVLFLHCQYNFNKVLGIPGDADWHNPTLLRNKINQIINKAGTRGIVQICSAYSAIYACLGGNYGACFNLQFYLNHGYNLTTSFFYIEQMRAIHFWCGGGMEPLFNNWRCINATGYSQQQKLQQCRQIYVNQTEQHPNNICQYLKQYIACHRLPFRTYCGLQASWFDCENIRGLMDVAVPQCMERCYIASQSPSASHSEKKKETKDAFEAAFEHAQQHTWASDVYSQVAQDSRANHVT